MQMMQYSTSSKKKIFSAPTNYYDDPYSYCKYTFYPTSPIANTHSQSRPCREASRLYRRQPPSSPGTAVRACLRLACFSSAGN